MVENPLAVEILAGRFAEGEHVIVDVKGGAMVFKKETAVAQPA
jgi:ATP-dependent Clp protease ATP-binding subunit ClpA